MGYFYVFFYDETHDENHKSTINYRKSVFKKKNYSNYSKKNHEDPWRSMKECDRMCLFSTMQPFNPPENMVFLLPCSAAWVGTWPSAATCTHSGSKMMGVYGILEPSGLDVPRYGLWRHGGKWWATTGGWWFIMIYPSGVANKWW